MQAGVEGMSQINMGYGSVMHWWVVVLEAGVVLKLAHSNTRSTASSLTRHHSQHMGRGGGADRSAVDGGHLEWSSRCRVGSL